MDFLISTRKTYMKNQDYERFNFEDYVSVLTWDTDDSFKYKNRPIQVCLFFIYEVYMNHWELKNAPTKQGRIVIR